MAANGASHEGLSEEQLKVIRGDIPPEEKKKELNTSLEK
jgi:hypothetical protein